MVCGGTSRSTRGRKKGSQRSHSNISGLATSYHNLHSFILKPVLDKSDLHFYCPVFSGTRRLMGGDQMALWFAIRDSGNRTT